MYYQVILCLYKMQFNDCASRVTFNYVDTIILI